MKICPYIPSYVLYGCRQSWWIFWYVSVICIREDEDSIVQADADRKTNLHAPAHAVKHLDKNPSMISWFDHIPVFSITSMKGFIAGWTCAAASSFRCRIGYTALQRQSSEVADQARLGLAVESFRCATYVGTMQQPCSCKEESQCRNVIAWYILQQPELCLLTHTLHKRFLISTSTRITIAAHKPI